MTLDGFSTLKGAVRRLVVCSAVLVVAPATPAQDTSSTTGGGEPRYELEAFVRGRAETRNGVGDNPQREDGFGISRLRLNFTVRPSKMFRFFVQAQDSRVAGLAKGRNPRAFKDSLDFRQGYVEFGRTDGTFQLSVGRRELNFIDGRLLGSRDWHNISPMWDGSMLTLHRGQDSVNLLAVTQVDVLDGFNLPSRKRFLHGMFGSISSWADGQTVEPFFLTTRRPRDLESNLGGMLRTAGSRFVGKFHTSFDYQVILATQWGGERDYPHRAWMGVWEIGKTFESAPTSPRVGVEWNYASGDRDPEDGRSGTFDTLFPSPHGRFGEQDIASHRNIKMLIAGVDLHPRKSLRIDLDFLDMRLASLQDGLYQLNFRRRIAPPPGGAESGFVGSELDLVVRYRPVSRVELRFGVSRFFPGEFVTRNLPGGESQTFVNAIITLRL